MMRWMGLFLLVMIHPVSSEADPVDTIQIRFIMGTTATVRAWAPDSTLAEAAVDTAFAVFTRVDRLMSTWKDDSNLSELNRAEPGRWVRVGPEVCRVLAVAKQVAGFSDGAFDPTVLPLVRLWGFRGPQVEVPDPEALAAALAVVDHDLLEVDEASGRARLLAPGMAVDLGGIAKGWALDRGHEAMLAAGATGGVIDLGGNVLVFGREPHRQMGIVNPANENELLATVPVVEAAAATSGQYERFLTINGRQYGHILDPRTGWPVDGKVSATVIAPRAVMADALATAAVVLGSDRGLKMLEEAPGVEGVLALDDGNGAVVLVPTSGFELPPQSP